ncbi:MAG TPA: dihydrofolate reductase [Thermoanaerobaculia bacterium]|nr:dihydrofolate reductase [Thermoanaerobaculia bacterium]
MRVSLVVAVADDGIIGRAGDLPWRLPADLQRFKQLTMGHHLVVGRKTWESIGRALRGRRMVVVSRGEPELPAEVLRAASLDEALSVAREAGDDEVLVGGGGELYRQALPLAQRVYLTRVHAAVSGETHFPGLDPRAWREVAREDRAADADNPHPLSFLVLERVAG